ncbi:MAG: 4-hydroxy-tetrahydrodipicolinate reductase [Lentisphaerae bacterium]|nr:4-hydroxy-tetrahydrodipicolinate reductase [Lentisphaerota bacterium]
MTTIAILGAAGRMGQMLIRCAARLPELRVTGACERAGHPALGQDAGQIAGTGPLGVVLADAWPADSDVVIDFTFHTAVAANLASAVARRQAVVLGTTGLSDDDKQRVADAAQTIPIVFAPNFSLGVNLLLDLVRRAATVLGPAYDAEIVEMHHRLKKDAPSGTALGLAEALAAGRGVDLKDVATYGREGIVGERPRGEIGIHAVRGGDVIGDHTVLFAADGERVELTHKATSRESFANGALHAALWLPGKPAGRYSMRDVLGL